MSLIIWEDRVSQRPPVRVTILYNSPLLTYLLTYLHT